MFTNDYIDGLLAPCSEEAGEGENIEYLDVELKHEEAISISEMILELREEITM